MKRGMTPLLVLALLCGLLLVGCTASANGPGPAAGSSEGTPVTEFKQEDESVRLQVELDRESYTTDTLIETVVTITNTSQNTLAYVQGSGSNICPDALKYTMGDLTALFYPQIVTMDYRVNILEPGQELRLNLGFAPYIANVDDLWIGTDKDISFFQESEDFTPAPSGRVQGLAVFTYRVLSEDAQPETLLSNFEELEAQTLTLEFETTIA